MDLSLRDIRMISLKKWSDTRFTICNDNDDPDRDNATAIPLDQDLAEAITRATEQPYSPWLVPGVGISI